MWLADTKTSCVPGISNRRQRRLIVGTMLTYMAAHGEAAQRLERAIEHYPTDRRRLDLVRFGSDLRASASAHHTVNLLSLGRLDDASRTALFSIEERRAAPVIRACCAFRWHGRPALSF